MSISRSNINLQVTRGNKMAKRPKKTKIIKNPDTKGLPRKTFEYLYPEQKTKKVPDRQGLAGPAGPKGAFKTQPARKAAPAKFRAYPSAYKRTKGMKVNKKTGGGFPDVTGDGKVTQKDILVKRGVLKQEGDKFVAKQYGGSLTDDIKKIKKAGGGMTYQLYGGTSKNIRDGNKEVSQFYDKE